MDSYTNRAKIGVLSQKMKNFDDLEIELKKDILENIRNDERTKTCKETFNKLLLIFQANLSNFNEQLLQNQFNKLFDYEINKDTFLETLESYNTELEDIVGKKYSNIYIKLDGILKKFPPNFQILMHELRYDPKMIRIFGPNQKISPFRKN